MRHPANFRTWLVHKLMVTRYARVDLEHADLDDLGRRLGVQPDVIRDAHARLLEQRKQRSLRLVTGDNADKNARAFPQLKVAFCRPVWEEWQAECERRGMDSPTLMRALVHAYLLSGWEPEVLVARGWYWQGKLHAPDATLKERSLVTNGARTAFGLRAATANVTFTTLLRGLILHVLDGKLPLLRPIDARTMWDDPEKYNALKS